MKNLPPTLFFDAAGTLIQVREAVAHVYERIAAGHGVRVDEAALDTAFRSAWKELPHPLHPQPPADDDRAWWRALVSKTFAVAQGKTLDDEVLNPLFDELYDHYAMAQAWSVYEEVPTVLHQLQQEGHRLYVVSNFDKRLKRILDGHDLSRFFNGLVISSEVGASKPHRRIFEAALASAQAKPEDCLHVGDDTEADVAGAEALGIHAMHLHRPEQTLQDLLGS